ncbi:MAG: hypothetical protein RLZZ338_1921 [Cyanobacteriota bacterium]
MVGLAYPTVVFGDVYSLECTFSRKRLPGEKSKLPKHQSPITLPPLQDFFRKHYIPMQEFPYRVRARSRIQKNRSG